jgi:ATP-dependent Clp protease ATP-binding subunit ClpC
MSKNTFDQVASISTGPVRIVIQNAIELARRHRSSYVGTEHVLHALVSMKDSKAVGVLIVTGHDIYEIRKALEVFMSGLGKDWDPSELSLAIPVPTPRFFVVFDLAEKVARESGDSHVCTQHLLLGILREAQGIGARVLMHQFGVLEEDVVSGLLLPC